jgi:acetylornithine deacetylase
MQRDGHAVVVRTHTERILVRERNVDRRTRRRTLSGAARPEFKPETHETIAIPPLRPEPANPACAIAQRLGAALTNAGLPFGTEGGFFQGAGIPTIVCGPGSIEQAHQPDEWVAVDQLEQASRFLNQMMQWAVA